MKTYLITAATGIGAETARIIAREGGNDVQIFFSSLEEDPCPALAEEIHALGAEAAFRVGDLTERPFAATLVHACVERFGRLDALFNVAGGSGRRFGDGPAHLCTDDGWDRTLALNLTTQFRMCRAALNIFLSQPVVEGLRGTILNMSSILALDPAPEYFDAIAYATSKGAIVTLTRSLAAAYAPQKIRVNAVAPALVRTAMSARASENDAVLAYVHEKQPLSEGMIPIADVARVCADLLLPGTRAITGQCVAVDAGWGVSDGPADAPLPSVTE